MSAQPPLVSIIIPTYNMRQWIGEAIDSALAQTYPHCEIIVVDDGSTDGTGNWIQERYGDRVLYRWQPHRGVARARNHGLSLAHGDYIQFLDADDLLRPEKIAMQVHFLEQHPEYAVVYCQTLKFNAEDPPQICKREAKERYQSGRILASMVDDGYILPHAALIRRSWVERIAPFDESLPSNEDWDFWLRMASAGALFYYLPGEVMALYRVHNRSRSSRHIQHALSGIMVLQKLQQAIRSSVERQRLKLDRAIGFWRFRYGKALAEGGYLRQGLWQMLQGILADRRDLDSKLGFLACCLLIGPNRASDAMLWLKQIKDSILLSLSGADEG